MVLREAGEKGTQHVYVRIVFLTRKDIVSFSGEENWRDT